ncbi:MAG: anti-sigma factor family protein [Phycisphaerae bacterium]
MNCHEFEHWMADILGGELSAQDRAAFDDHLAACQACRTEYESAAATVRTLRSLPPPPDVSVRRSGDRLVISGARSGRVGGRRRLASAILRYAAAIALAFAGGYGYHATQVQVARVDARQGGGLAAAGRNETFRSALANAHAHNPDRSDLAKCLSALFPASGGG